MIELDKKGSSVATFADLKKTATVPVEAATAIPLFMEARGFARAREAQRAVGRELDRIVTEGRFRLTDVLNEAEPYRTWALEILTGWKGGRQLIGDGPYRNLRVKMKCIADKVRSYRIGMRITGTMQTAEATNTEPACEVQFVEPLIAEVQPGAIYEMSIEEASGILAIYGRETPHWLPEAEKADRPWIEILGEDAGAPKRGPGRPRAQASNDVATP